MALGISRKTAVIAAASILTILAIVLLRRARVEKVALITGAVIADDADPHKQKPIRSAIVKAESDEGSGEAVSESSGLFRLRMEPAALKGEEIRLRVVHPDYQPFVITAPADQQIYVIRLTSARSQPDAPAPPKTVRLANIRVRYATNIQTTNTIGTMVRTFDVRNTGNVPCQNRAPCSPDGKWKATIGSLSLDTGEVGKQFRNVRVSCLAGPCPFTAIESDRFSRGGRQISVSVRNWSDRVTYLLEAEISHTMASEMIRYTYPAILGRLMNFTLPVEATGSSIYVDMDGSQIVFPLGPALRLSWANCTAGDASDGAKIYRCELEPGYVFGSETDTVETAAAKVDIP